MYRKQPISITQRIIGTVMKRSTILYCHRGGSRPFAASPQCAYPYFRCPRRGGPVVPSITLFLPLTVYRNGCLRVRYPPHTFWQANDPALVPNRGAHCLFLRDDWNRRQVAMMIWYERRHGWTEGSTKAHSRPRLLVSIAILRPDVSCSSGTQASLRCVPCGHRTNPWWLPESPAGHQPVRQSQRSNFPMQLLKEI